MEPGAARSDEGGGRDEAEDSLSSDNEWELNDFEAAALLSILDYERECAAGSSDRYLAGSASLTGFEPLSAALGLEPLADVGAF